MSIRTLLLLIVLFPTAIIAAALALGQTIPVPIWGRDYVVGVPLADTELQAELPGVVGPDDPSLPLVVIDPGHGGRDPGASGPSIVEKEVVLAIALALRDELLRGGRIRVALTRSDDRKIRLADRPEIARQLDADLFLSIHADSAGDKDEVRGASIYTLSNKASSQAAARFAARENNADRLNGVTITDQSEEVSSILVELAQQQTQDQATEFSSLILREGQGRVEFHPEAQRSAALAVLRAPDVPAVLFESGFVTNRADRAKLVTEEGRATYADVLARAIRVYFARRSET